jgi:hypothetical protein
MTPARGQPGISISRFHGELFSRALVIERRQAKQRTREHDDVFFSGSNWTFGVKGRY